MVVKTREKYKGRNAIYINNALGTKEQSIVKKLYKKKGKRTMRVTFYKNIKTMSGLDKEGKMVFNSVKNDSVCIVRRYVYPRITMNNNHMGQKLRMAANLWKYVNAAFKTDCQRYADAYNAQYVADKKLYIGAYNVFIMGVCKHPTAIDSLNGLDTALGSTIQDWIETEYLKPVSTPHSFDATVLGA